VIVAVPAPTPDTTPDPETVATSSKELLHNTPGVVELNVVVCPKQTEVVPVIGAGRASTVTTVVVIQLVGPVYVIIEVPTPTAFHNPVATSIVATEPVPDNQVPPPVALLSVADVPWQSIMVPVMAAGAELTVTTATEIQPLGKV